MRRFWETAALVVFFKKKKTVLKFSLTCFQPWTQYFFYYHLTFQEYFYLHKMAYKKSKFFKPRPRKSSGSQTSQVTAGTPARTRLATDPNSKQSKQTSLSSYFGESSNQHSDGSEESDAGRPTKKSKSETSKTRGKSLNKIDYTPWGQCTKNKARKRATSKTRLRIPSSSKSDDKDTDSATENDHADKPLSPLLDFDEMEDSADEYQAEKRKRKPRAGLQSLLKAENAARYARWFNQQADSSIWRISR